MASLADIEPALELRLNELQCGDCTEEEFVREILAQCESFPNLVWTTLALVDQRYRCGHLRRDLFLSIKSKIARHEFDVRDYGVTVDMNPASGASSAATQPPVPPAGNAVEAAPRADSENNISSGDASELGAPVVESAPRLDSSEKRKAPRARDVGRLLCDRYMLESVLGSGGTSTVFKALDRQRADLAEERRHMALKTLNADVNEHPEVLVDLYREFYCAQALSHPNIVKLFEIHHHDDVAFFTMELLEGELVSSVLEHLYPQPLERSCAWAIIRDVGAGLAHAHARGVVHGDIKPQNIFITSNREVRILDFGVSATATRHWSRSDALQRDRLPAVTLAYACCELLDGQQTDPRDDLYSLACLAYELLSGKHPFQRLRSTEAREIGMRPDRPPGLTQRQWRALRLGLSWQRDSRSLSVRAWLAMIGLAPAVVNLPPLSGADRLHPASWKRVGLRHAVVAVCLLAGVGVWVTFSQLRFDRSPKTSAPNATLGAANHGPAPSLSDVVLPTQKRSAIPTAMVTDAQPPVPATLPPSVAGTGGAAASTQLRTTGARKITLSADTYQVRMDQRFAEVIVRRSNGASGSTSFVWWTEVGSAKPGRDFVGQNRTMQLFPKGSSVARLFVRIVPNPNRKPTDVFYVVVGAPSPGYTLGSVTRAAILAPDIDFRGDGQPVASNTAAMNPRAY
jgi:serine/threonine protein kinase